MEVGKKGRKEEMVGGEGRGDERGRKEKKDGKEKRRKGGREPQIYFTWQL